MRSTSPTALLALALACGGLAGCQTPVRAPDKAPASVPKPVKAKPAPVEPAVSAESRELYRQALAALGTGRYAEAERGLLAVSRREPRLAGPHANLGILYGRTGRPAQAFASLQEAVRLNPGRAAYYNELGVISRREGKFEDAGRYYAKALDLDPDYAYAHLNIGILYDLYLQDSEKAVQHYRRYQELTPGEAGTVTKWIADLQQRDRARQAKGGKGG
ncbi:MAG TPA: tetratricopeptide repeat protein [Burkholderiales bacterium]|nr:tetratricopeptide repeat protein [Burkholderiales bacterium]